MGAIPADAILDDIAHQLLDVTVAALGAFAPARVAVTPGPAVWELCTADQVAVCWLRLRPSAPLTSTSPGPHRKLVATVADFRIEVIRCVATMDNNGRPPPPATLEDDALKLASDAKLMWYGITESVRTDTLVDGCTEVTYSQVQVNGPEGGKASVSMEITVQL